MEEDPAEEDAGVPVAGTPCRSRSRRSPASADSADSRPPIITKDEREEEGGAEPLVLGWLQPQPSERRKRSRHRKRRKDRNRTPEGRNSSTPEGRGSKRQVVWRGSVGAERGATVAAEGETAATDVVATGSATPRRKNPIDAMSLE